MFDLIPVKDAISDFLPEIAQYQLSFFRNPEVLHGYLKSPNELVSQVDITSENMIHHHLKAILPDAAFFGEETNQEIGEEFTWVVDPVDGTVNYVSGLHEWSISIGLLYKREPILGMVCKPTADELFWAVKDKGAFLGEIPLPIMPFHGTLHDAVIATGFPFRSQDVAPGFYRMAEELLPHCREIRRFGSAALDLSYTAAGFFQAYWETDLKLYDSAAALVILREAGIVVKDFYGESFDPVTSRSFCAGHPSIIEELLPFTRRHYEEYTALLSTI